MGDDNWDDRGLTDDGPEPDAHGNRDDGTATFDTLLTAENHSATDTVASESGQPFAPPADDDLYRPEYPNAAPLSPPDEADLFTAQHDTGESHRGARSAGRAAGRRKYWLAGGAAAAVAVVLGGVVFAVLRFAGGVGGTDPSLAAMYPTTSTTTPPSNSQAAPPVQPAFCNGPGTGGATVTRGPGGRSSGVDAIAGMEYAYYADRDANKVVSFYAPALGMKPAAIQPYIDQVVEGAQHCVTIEPAKEPNQYRVSVDLKLPNRNSLEPVDPLLITTADSPSGWVITKAINVS